MECKICGKEWNVNHMRVHNMTNKEYYDLYFKKPNEGFCEDCGIPVTYYNFNIGYAKICIKCSCKRASIIKNQRLKVIKDARPTYEVVCETCNETFITLKADQKHCNKKTCSHSNCTDPRIKESILYHDENGKICPYCGKEYDKNDKLMFHLSSHFTKKELPDVKLYLRTHEWIQLKKYCKECKKEIQDGKYCIECQNKRVWTKYTDYDEISRKAQIKIKAFNETEEGKACRKRAGAINREHVIAFNKTERGIQIRKDNAIKQSIVMKEKIANGEFVPNITSYWTHWEAVVYVNEKEFRFRSSWEATFWLSNQHTKYEVLRIKYIGKDDKPHTYIADFYDDVNNILYEIKPKSMWKYETDKMNKIIEHCITENIKFVWINEDNINDYINIEDFTDERNILQLNKCTNGNKKN